jgi:hypothetical protein
LSVSLHISTVEPFSPMCCEYIGVYVGGNGARYPVVLRHMIWHPTEVTATDDESTGPVIRVVDQDGTATLVTFYPKPD